MNRFKAIPVSLLSCFSVLVILLLWAQSTLAQPKITFKETTFDFGSIDQDLEFTHTFEFANEGNEVVKIDKVKAS